MTDTNVPMRLRLLRRAEAFARDHGTTLKALGWRVMKNSHVLVRVKEEGGDVTTETFERFQAFFDAQDCAGPGGVGAPTPPAAEMSAGS